VNPKPFEHWLKGGGKSSPQANDKDVFRRRHRHRIEHAGHTPGHHSLLVKLKGWARAARRRSRALPAENYETNGVSLVQYSRAETVASLDRFKKIAANLKATVILQHDARDVGKLPAFPAAAK
jgi:hypothetical protein